MRRWVAYICLCAMLLVLPMAAIADTTPTVTITLDKDTVAVGETVTATYQVSGEGEYTEVMWQWAAQIEDGSWQGIIGDEAEDESNVSDRMSGTFSATPGFGSNLRCSIYVKEANGRWHYDLGYWSLPVTGSYSYPPSVTLTLDKEAVSIGEQVTASYDVKGAGEYDQVMWRWAVQIEDESWQTIFSNEPDESNVSSELNRSFVIKPEFGQKLRCSISVRESSGRWHYDVKRIEVPVSGYVPKKPEIYLALDKSSMAIGERITASYEISGDVACNLVLWSWSVRINESEGQSITEAENISENMAGSFSITPRFGCQLNCTLYVVATNGRVYESDRITIPIYGFAPGYDTYEIIKGADTQIATGAASLTFCADGDFKKFLDIQVDGAYVPKDAYTAWSGSTYVELSADYLNTLSDGPHELTVIFDDGIAVTDFTVDRDANKTQLLPQTGDNSHLALWLAVLTMAGVAMLILRRKAHN